jgi:capsid protein
MAYTTLTGDLEAVNYSSIRAGLLSERDQYRMLAQWMAVHSAGRSTRAGSSPRFSTYAIRVDARLASDYDDVEWQGRGWKWVDPLNDLQAAEAAIRLGLDTRHRLAAEAGLDLEENIDQLAEEQDYARAAGVDVSGSATPTPSGRETPDARDARQITETTPSNDETNDETDSTGDTNALILPRRRVA